MRSRFFRIFRLTYITLFGFLLLSIYSLYNDIKFAGFSVGLLFLIASSINFIVTLFLVTYLSGFSSLE